MGGPDMAPQTPQRSEPPGEAVALLDTPTGSSLAGVVPGRLGRRAGCPHVLGPDTDPDEPGGNPPQEGEAREEADGEWRLQRPRAGQDGRDEAPLDHHLDPLGDARRQLAPLLNRAQLVDRRPPVAQW